MSAESTADYFTVDYFIAKFEAIPDEKWCTDVFENMTGACCALGHCGERVWAGTHESIALRRLFSPIGRPDYINDGVLDTIVTEYGNTPKERILNALREIKSKEESK